MYGYDHHRSDQHRAHPSQANGLNHAYKIDDKLFLQSAYLHPLSECPNRFEYEIESEILHEFNRHGARFPSYNSIIAGGDNACILHYTENDQPLKDGDLVLIDAGCEFAMYAVISHVHS